MPDIAINDVTPRIQYTATGGQTVFPYPFAVFAQTDLKVYLTPADSEPDDVADLLVLTTEYTVSGVGAEAGGNVTLVTGATLNDVITIERDMPIERSTDFQLAGDFLAATLNNELDRVTMMIQQIETIFERRGLSFARSVDLQGVSLLLPKPSGSKVLAMNAGATELVWADIVALGVVATAFVQTLLDDVTASDARTTLGLGTAAVVADNTLVHLAGAEQITGAKDIVDDSTFYDAAAATKKVRLDASGVTAGQTRVITAPDVNVTLPYKPGTYGGSQVYTASDTWIKPAGLKRVRVIVTAGGGGGGGCAQAGSAAAGGGGAGATSIDTIEAADLGATETVTVGAAGAGGTAGNNAGSTGGTSSFGTHCACAGGAGGAAGNTGTAGLGGAVTTPGDIDFNGGAGHHGNIGAGVNGIGGNGGASYYGGGGLGAQNTGNGAAGLAYGAGGAGGADNNTTNTAGGAGKAGIVIVEEFF